MTTGMPSFVKGMVGLGAIAVLAAILTAIPVNALTAGFAFLVAVMIVATTWGLGQAVVVSVAAMLCLNFFFMAPVGTFTIEDPQNWVALFGFVAAAIITSQLSAKAKHEARTAVERQRELEQLYLLSRALLLDTDRRLAARVALHIAGTLGLESVLLYDATARDLQRGGTENIPLSDEELEESVKAGSLPESLPPGTRASFIRLGGQPRGIVVVRGKISAAAVEAAAGLVAIGLERARAQETAARAEAARQSDELRSALLDAMAHELKTPLTSIKAASTAFLSGPVVAAGEQRELVTIIDEEADRLTSLVTDALQMARLEAGVDPLDMRPTDVERVIRRAVGTLNLALADRPVDVAIEPALPQVRLDADLMVLALRHLIDNAVKYSPRGSAIRIAAARSDEAVKISVADDGPGIPAVEQPRIFERFYRGAIVRSKIPGSGLGLAIVRQIVTAHAGVISLESGAGRGTRFDIRLPLGASREAA
jgi:two-component system sensor histidine kinase KdpD